MARVRVCGEGAVAGHSITMWDGNATVEFVTETGRCIAKFYIEGNGDDSYAELEFVRLEDLRMTDKLLAIRFEPGG